MSFRIVTAGWFLAGTALAVLAGLFVRPAPLNAQKLPVDCSGRATECYTHRTCAEWVQNNRCLEYHTEVWRWYR